MTTLAEAHKLFDTLTPTRFDRAYIASIKPYRKRKVWYIVLRDNSGDVAPKSETYRTQTEAYAALPSVVSEYFGRDADTLLLRPSKTRDH